MIESQPVDLLRAGEPAARLLDVVAHDSDVASHASVLQNAIWVRLRNWGVNRLDVGEQEMHVVQRNIPDRAIVDEAVLALVRARAEEEAGVTYLDQNRDEFKDQLMDLQRQVTELLEYAIMRILATNLMIDFPEAKPKDLAAIAITLGANKYIEIMKKSTAEQLNFVRNSVPIATPPYNGLLMLLNEFDELFDSLTDKSEAEALIASYSLVIKEIKSADILK